MCLSKNCTCFFCLLVNEANAKRRLGFVFHHNALVTCVCRSTFVIQPRVLCVCVCDEVLFIFDSLCQCTVVQKMQLLLNVSNWNCHFHRFNFDLAKQYQPCMILVKCVMLRKQRYYIVQCQILLLCLPILFWTSFAEFHFIEMPSIFYNVMNWTELCGVVRMIEKCSVLSLAFFMLLVEWTKFRYMRDLDVLIQAAVLGLINRNFCGYLLYQTATLLSAYKPTSCMKHWGC